MRENLAKQRLGQVGKNKFGSVMVVEKYNTTLDIWVKFEQGNLVHTDYKAFCKGNVKNIFDRSVFGIGYIGQGDYKVMVDRKPTPQYATWRSMLNRCYNHNKEYCKNNYTYIDCTVSDEWHNFQTFSKWYDENYYEIQGEEIQLDKDILIKGNKIYSHETCVFVPKKINTLFIKGDSMRGEFPIGVSFNKNTNKYSAKCSDKGKILNLGYHYDTPEEAFRVYKSVKEKLIKEVAKEYKNKIPVKLYEVIIRYTVDIND